MFEAILREDNRNPEVFRGLSIAEEVMMNFEKALEHQRRAIELAGQNYGRSKIDRSSPELRGALLFDNCIERFIPRVAGIGVAKL